MVFSHTWRISRPVFPHGIAMGLSRWGSHTSQPGSLESRSIGCRCEWAQNRDCQSFLCKQVFAACLRWEMNQGKRGGSSLLGKGSAKGPASSGLWSSEAPCARRTPHPFLHLIHPCWTLSQLLLFLQCDAGLESRHLQRGRDISRREGSGASERKRRWGRLVHCWHSILCFSEALSGARDKNSSGQGGFSIARDGAPSLRVSQTPLGLGWGYREWGAWKPLCKSLAIPALPCSLPSFAPGVPSRCPWDNSSPCGQSLSTLEWHWSWAQVMLRAECGLSHTGSSSCCQAVLCCIKAWVQHGTQASV